MLAVGSYSGAAAVVDPTTRELLCVLEGGHAGGITHVSLLQRCQELVCCRLVLAYGSCPGGGVQQQPLLALVLPFALPLLGYMP